MTFQLSGPDILELRDLTVAAHDINSLTQMLRGRLDMRLDTIVAPTQPLDTVVYKLVDHANRRGWVDSLVLQLAQDQPGRSDIYAFAAQVGLAPNVDGASSDALNGQGGILRALESLTDPVEGFGEVKPLINALARLQRQVCRVEVDGQAVGTGFLVGPDRVMTNHHVVEDVINGQVGIDRVLLRFDYSYNNASGAGFRLAGGTVEGAIPHYSPPTAEEKAGKANVAQPDDDHLDFALLKVAGKPGEQALVGPGTLADNNFKPGRRGWISSEEIPPKVHKDGTAFILQHPGGMPLSFSWRKPGITAVMTNRVTYRNNTDSGSSGSPCLNHRLQLIALHHSGNLKANKDATMSNQGIPINSIISKLRNLGDEVSLKPPENGGH